MTQHVAPVDPDTLKAVQSSIFADGLRHTARRLDVNHETLSRVARKGMASPVVLAKLRSKVTTREDYARAATEFRQPLKRSPQFGWSLESIRAARDAQACGNFRQAAQLAKAMQFDDAIFVARNNRIAPINALTTRLQSQESSRGAVIAKRAEASVTVKQATLAAIDGTMAMHGVAIGYVRHQPNEDGTKVDFVLEEWPIETVRWVEIENSFVTQTYEGQQVSIKHGDGHWVIFGKYELQPWLQEAALLPSALVFAAHLDAIKDWAAASRSHGMAKIIGELPAGMALLADDGIALSPEAQSFLDMIAGIVGGDVGAGIIPSGSKADFVTNTSAAWQVFSELLLNREKAGARIWSGNDGQLGASSNAPGADLETLFGVAATKVQGDVKAIEMALYEGVYVPWTAINVGDSSLAPRYVFELPNKDEAEKSKQRSEAMVTLCATLERYKANGIEITQEIVNTLAKLHGVEPVPRLATVGDARLAQGLPLFGDTRDALPIIQLDVLRIKSPTDSPSVSIAPAVADETPPLAAP